MRTPHASSRLRNVSIPGPEGVLEGIVRTPERPEGAAVMAHPHPLFGGTMHTKVVHAAARLMADRLGLVAVRFNFRGVGASAGAHDEGRGEVDDVVAACTFARGLLDAPEDSAGRGAVGGSWGERAAPPMQTLVLGGFSFGSLCALRAQPRVRAAALLLVGIPLDRMDPKEREFASGARVVWIHGEKDTTAPLGDGHDLAARAGWDLRVVPGADHFFSGKLGEFEEQAADGLERALGKAVKETT